MNGRFTTGMGSETSRAMHCPSYKTTEASPKQSSMYGVGEGIMMLMVHVPYRLTEGFDYVVDLIRIVGGARKGTSASV